MNPLTRVKRQILSLWARAQLRRFEVICQNPELEYQKTWSQLVRLLKNGPLPQLGKNPPLESLKRLPLSDYTDYKEAFEKTTKTKVNPYSLGKINFWVTTTGTSGQKKIFPFSPSLDKGFRKSVLIRIPQLIDKYLILTSPPEIIFILPGDYDEAYPTLPMGVIGYYHYKNIPNAFAYNFTFSKKLYKTEEIYNKWYILMSLMADATSISTTIPVKLLHFLDHLNNSRDKLLDHLKSGNWPKELTHLYNKKRISFLLNALQVPIVNVKDLWPSLKFICLWKSGESCRRQLKELRSKYDFPAIDFIDQIYSGSEAVFNMPLLNEVGGPVNLFGSILEFQDCETKEVFWPWQLTNGKMYNLLVTNALGLIRYQMYDKVICTGYFQKLAKIAFHSRSPVEISLGWGAIREEELIKAIQESGIENFGEFYFELNEKGNGIQLVSHRHEYKTKVEEIEKKLLGNNWYLNQLCQENIMDGLTFKHVSFEDYQNKMVKNINTKRILLE